jgi:clan AA aspartic protease
MILGTVNDELEPCIQLLLRSVSGKEVKVSGVVDTGFAGYLTAPQKLIDRLRLTKIGPAEATLADGSEVEMDNYRAEVIWNGRRRIVYVLAADDVLVGTAMLRHHSLRIDMVECGNVVIRPRRVR